MRSMIDKAEKLRLSRLNKYMLRLAIPRDYLHNHGLKEGDRVLWIPDAEGVRLKFVKVRREIVEYELEEEQQGQDESAQNAA
jgi:hypothetical protein